MPHPFGVGDIVGGRYKITHHVVTSADQDVIFQATDQVLGREVSVLLASWANTKQVATSARELATGNRSSPVEVLDLGLTEDRTYLISTLVDPNQLLDLVVPDAAPYVEPYYTDSLGSELFGRSREMKPQTFDDDAEYYSRLHQAGKLTGLRGRRPAFLDRVPGKPRRPAAEPPAPEPLADSHPVDSPSQPSLIAPVDVPAGHAPPATPLAASPESSAKSPISFLYERQIEQVSANPGADTSEQSFSATRAPTQRTDPGSAVPPQLAEPEKPVAVAAAPDTAEPVQGSLPDLRTERPQASVPAPKAPPSAQESEADPWQIEHFPSAAVSILAASGTSTAQPLDPGAQRLAEGEEVIDSPPDAPDDYYDVALGATRSPAPPQGPAISPSPAAHSAAASWADTRSVADKNSAAEDIRYRFSDQASFTSLISVVPDQPATSLNDSPAETSPVPPAITEGPQQQDSVLAAKDPTGGSRKPKRGQDESTPSMPPASGKNGIGLTAAAIAAAVLALIMLSFVVVLFIIL